MNFSRFAPLTPFRHYVMGDARWSAPPPAMKPARIAALLGEAMDAGAFGFSSTVLKQHMGYGGRPLACRNASHAEYRAYGEVLKARGRGAVEVALTRQIAVLEDDGYELLDVLLEASGRPVTFIAMFDRDDIPEAVRDTLAKVAPLIARGARPQTSPLPLTRELNMRNPFVFAPFPSWRALFVDQSKPAQRAVYADPAFRAQFREDLKRPQTFRNWTRVRVHEVRKPELKGYEGKTIDEIAKAEGKDPVDAFLDLTLADDLDNEFILSTFNHRVDRMKEILANRDMLLGLCLAAPSASVAVRGILHTIVNGEMLYENGAVTDARAGQVLRS
ncbi:MAG: hypothetical protein IPM80_10825 [Proteobacteria bacterium]|nr:hypothetical protein [Pseudomonadota bacterium]